MTLKWGNCINNSFIKKSMSVNSDSLNFFRTIFYTMSFDKQKMQESAAGIERFAEKPQSEIWHK